MLTVVCSSVITEKDVGKRAYRTYGVISESYPVGFVFNSLTVCGLPLQKRVGKNAVHWFLPVKCKCGKELTVSVGHLRHGKTKSCSCERLTRIKDNNPKATHRCSSDPILSRLCAAHNGMLQRCSNSSDSRYGARGIKICDEWRSDRYTFILWALDNGYSPGMQLDRKDNNKGYFPDNCHYIDAKQNGNNRSSNVHYTINGVSKTISEWCSLHRRDQRIVYQRVKTYGWDLSRALSTPTTSFDDGHYVYLAWRKSDNVFTIGKSSSLKVRFQKLQPAGFKLLTTYECSSARDAGFLEVLWQNWMDRNGISRGVASKSQGSSHSWETFYAPKESKFKFLKICKELENSIPDRLEALRATCLRLREGFVLHKLRNLLNQHGVKSTIQDGLLKTESNAIGILPILDISARNTDATHSAYKLYKESKTPILFLDPVVDITPRVQHWIFHKLGLSKTIVGARKCTIDVVPWSIAEKFYKDYHLQGPTSGSHFGLFFNQAVVACMTFSKQAPDRKKILDQGGYALTRFALAGAVPGAASRLFKYAVTRLGATSVVTYSDNRYAVGDVYGRLGFVLEAEIGVDYRVWHSKTGIRHKSYWQRRVIPTRLRHLGINDTFDPKTDLRTEFDMEELAGCKHVWDCGKKRWLWKAAAVPPAQVI